MPDTRKVKVLHIITRLDPGGSSTNTLQTVARLDRARYDADLVVGKTLDPEGVAAAFIRDHNIRAMFIDSLVREVHLWKDLVAFIRLCAVIRRGGYDIVHTHSSKAGILGRWAAFICGVRKIVHTPHGHVFYGYFSNFMTRIFLFAERRTAKITSRLIALTQRGIDEHRALRVGRQEQWTAIPSGIDVSVVRPSAEDGDRVRRELGLKDSDLVFIAVGRLEPVKGQATLIEAMALVIGDFPRIKLLIVGEGSCRASLDLQAKRLGVRDNVVFTGFRKDVSRVLCAADVFVMASVNEGMGRAVLEAMAAGLPVIVSRVGGLPSIVEDAREGFLVTAGDCVAWAGAMRQMVLSPEMRRSMSQAARARVNETFSVERMVRQIEEVYAQL